MPVYKDNISNTWYVNSSYIDPFGERKYIKKRGFKTKKLATEYNNRILNEKQMIKTSPVKMNELYESWYKYRESRVKPRTMYDYDMIYKKHISPTFGDMYIDKIKIPLIESWQNKLLEANYRNDYMEKIQYTLKSLFSYAVKKLIINNSPFDYLEYVRNKNQKRDEMKFLTPEQFNIFIESVPQKYKLVFNTLYWTGMRISELQARSWNDLDFNSSTLRIHSNWDTKNNQITNTTKNGKDRTIYIPNFILDDLKELYRENSQIDGFSNDFFIFGTNKPIPQKTVSNVKNKVLEEHPELPQIRIHDLRHSHVSYLINNGADAYDVADRLGHTVDMVNKRYYHMFPDKINKLKGFLDK